MTLPRSTSCSFSTSTRKRRIRSSIVSAHRAVGSRLVATTAAVAVKTSRRVGDNDADMAGLPGGLPQGSFRDAALQVRRSSPGYRPFKDEPGPWTKAACVVGFGSLATSRCGTVEDHGARCWLNLTRRRAEFFTSAALTHSLRLSPIERRALHECPIFWSPPGTRMASFGAKLPVKVAPDSMPARRLEIAPDSMPAPRRGPGEPP
jgi:hypothetical protein